MILPLLLIPPILVVISGVSSISMYMTPEYTDAWSAMFIQSALLFGYYLLPFSMVIVCVMISNRETKNNGILKMLALPISKGKLAEVSVAPHSEGKTSLNIKVPENGKCYLKLIYQLKKEMPLLEKDHILGFDEIEVSQKASKCQLA